MNRKHTWLGLLAAAVAFAALAPRTAGAQWSATAIGVAEYDTDELLLLLAGVSASPEGRGWKPRVGVQGYHLSYDSQGGRTNVVTFRPYVGIGNSYDGGSVNLNVGYAFSNKDKPFVSPAVSADNSDGVVLSGGWEYWGTGGPLGYQALASYNFESQSIWTRGRATTRLQRRDGGGQTRLGAEVAYLNGDRYEIVQPGAVLLFHGSSGRILGVGAGMKFYDGGGDAVYFKLEGVLPIGR